jgi:hypothetical protein
MDTTEPGPVSQVILKKHKSWKPRGRPEVETRHTKFAGEKAASPMTCRDIRVEIPGAGMEQRGRSRSIGVGGLQRSSIARRTRMGEERCNTRKGLYARIVNPEGITTI